jgi:hypothetical protein
MCPQSILVDFDSRLDYLFNLKRLGIKVGLEHTIELLKRCGDPQLHFKSIHIAGTNGKGSTCAIVSSILMEAGLKVGLYTSPHLIRFNERIRINGIQIDDDDIVEFVDSYQSDIDEIKSTFFETTSAMAFKYFSDKKVDVAVVETGLGGAIGFHQYSIPGFNGNYTNFYRSSRNPWRRHFNDWKRKRWYYQKRGPIGFGASKRKSSIPIIEIGW